MEDIHWHMQERYQSRDDTGAVDLLVAGKRIRPILDRCGSGRDHYVIHFVYGGHGYVKHGDQTYRVGPGDLFAIFPNDNRGPYWSASDDPWQYYWVAFKGKAGDDLLARAGFSPEKRIRHADQDPTVFDLLERILGSLRDSEPGGDIYANATLMELLAYLIKRHSSKLPSHLAHNDTVERAKAFMSRRHGAGITTQDVAAHVGYERSYLSHMFHRETGSTLSEYIQKARNSHARDLLRTMDISIQSVSRAVGFNSYRSFSRWFKRMNGMAPSEFAKQERERF